MRPTPLPFALVALAVSMTLAACGDQPSTTTSPRLEPAAMAAAAMAAAKAPPAPPTPNVTSTMYDTDALGAALLTRSDDFNGTTSATYTAVNSVTSHIGGAGAWQLYLGNQTTRTIRLALASQGIPLADGNYSSNVEVYSKCFDSSNTQVSLLAMPAGAVNGNCSFGVDFSASNNGTKYLLVMGPTYSGTGRASVTCNAAAGGYCTNWTIVSNANVANSGVANLYTFSTSKGQIVLVYSGTYHNSYSVTAVQ